MRPLLLATLGADWRDGDLRLVDADDPALPILAGPWECQGVAATDDATAHGNPFCDPLRRFGHHPSGLWEVGEVLDSTTPEQEHSYGAARLVLRPVDGEALRAQRVGKRDGLRVHWGALDAKGRLRKANGCLRVHPEGEVELLAILRDRTHDYRPLHYDCRRAT